MLTLILERGRSVFDRFSLSAPCLVRPGLLQNVVRAVRHSRSVFGGRGRMLASGDQVVGALQVGAPAMDAFSLGRWTTLEKPYTFNNGFSTVLPALF